MRNAFVDEITKLAGGNSSSVVILSGDIGNRLFDKFKEKFPERFYNCGVAEANMVSLASGMAIGGLRPVVYTINSFITTRCFEQIRVDLCYHHVPVVLVGVGGGLSYASLGGTHHSLEDIAIMRVLPRMTVICPGDAWEVRAAIQEALKQEGPVYIRLGKKGEPVVHTGVPPFTIGKVILIKEGKEVCLLGCGNMLPTAVETAKELEAHGISTKVVSFHTIKPLDEEFLKEIFSRFLLVATIEEHSLLGGLGGSVAEWLSNHFELRGRLLRFGTADTFLHEAGGQEYAREKFGLTPKAMAEKVLGVFAKR